MNAKVALVGFVLFIVSTFTTQSIVAPNIQSALMPLFGWAGTYAGLLFGSTVSFFVLILFFWAAHKAGLDAEIPEVG